MIVSRNIKNSLFIVIIVVASIVIFSPNSSLFAYGDSSIPVISMNYSIYNYLEQVQANYDSNYSQRNLWRLGENIQEGDYYEYKICNDDTMYQIIYPYHCYTISLEFVTILESYQGKVWIVQGNFITPNISEQIIFLIDTDNFKVNTDLLHKELGVSIQNTIFSLSKYGKSSLSIGTVWDYLDSYFTNKIPLEIKNKQSIQILNGSNYNGNYSTIETSVLSYDIIVPSNIYLHNDFPFTVQAKLYSPNIIYPEPKELYYYELLEYSTIDTIVDTKRNIQGELKEK